MIHRRWHYRALLTAIVVGCCAMIVRAAEDAVAVAQRALIELDQLAAVEANDDLRVAQLFNDVQAALKESRRSVASEAPATQPNDATAARLCQLDYLEAELHRRAGLALNDPTARSSQFEKAIAAYKSLRLEHRKLVAGMLGYVGEARVHMAMRNDALVETVLAPVAVKLDDRKLDQLSPSQLRMQRVLWSTRVEAAVLKNPLEGNKLAEQLAGSALMKAASPQELSALKWAVLKAQVKNAIAAKAADAAKYVDAIAAAEFAGSLSEHERLALLLELRDKCGVQLSSESSIRLARLFRWAKRNDRALEMYDLVSKSAPLALNVDDWQAYGTLLAETPRTADAAEAFAAALQSVEDGSPRRLEILRSIAHARTTIAQLPEANDSSRQAAIDALWQVIRGGADVEVQTQSLRLICFLAQRNKSLVTQLKQIDEFPDIVKNDPYVAYIVWQSRWNGAADNQKAAVALQARDALSPLIAAADDETAAAIVVLVAQTSASSNDGAAAALAMIEREQPRLAGSSSAAAANNLKLSLLLQLGQIEEAEKLAIAKDDGAGAETLIRLATILSDRFADLTAPQQQAALRERVAAVVTRGLANERSDPLYLRRAIAGSKALVKVGAYAQAAELINGLPATDASSRVEIAVLKAEALQGQQKFDAAVAVLEPLAGDPSTGGDAMLALGELHRKLNGYAAAAVAFRDARKKLEVGTEPWWRATIGLAEVLVHQKNEQAAREILRVAAALYRNSAPPTIQKRIDSILK